MLRAPFDAVVVARYVDTGAAVDPTIRVVRLARVGPPLVRFAVPASEGEGILVGACIEREVQRPAGASLASPPRSTLRVGH